MRGDRSRRQGPRDRAPFASEVVRVWTFHDGKAIRVRSYYATHGCAAALLGTEISVLDPNCNRRPLRRLTSRARAAEGQQTLEIEPMQSCANQPPEPADPHQ